MGDVPAGAVGLTLVLGGARSGKSAFAEAVVAGFGGSPVYVATGSPVDADMATRIAAHRARRGGAWTTIEAGPDLAGALGRVGHRPALVDALGTWVAAHWRDPAGEADRTGPGAVATGAGGTGAGVAVAGAGPAAVTGGGAAEDGRLPPPFPVDVAALVAALEARIAPTVVVSDEVGLGVHPSTEVGRHFRDALGLVNQAVAAVAGDVWLVVAGRGLRLEGP